DKAIGAALLAGEDLGRMGLVLSARVTGEIALKAARCGVAWIASGSVPTTLALRIAAAAGFPIVARAADRDAHVYWPPATEPRPRTRCRRSARSAPAGATCAKALAAVGGVRIIDRVIRALRAVTPDIVLITNDPDVFAPVGLAMRADARPGLGALGGIHTALLWAREASRPGVLAVACDMPFLGPRLLARLVEGAARGADVVVPESDGPRGVEPLCAYYSTRCIAAIERRIERGD